MELSVFNFGQFNFRVMIPFFPFGLFPVLYRFNGTKLNTSHALLALSQPDGFAVLDFDILHGADLIADAARRAGIKRDK
jgi:hypothetical protein